MNSSDDGSIVIVGKEDDMSCRRCAPFLVVLGLAFATPRAGPADERFELGLRFGVADVSGFQVTEPGFGIFGAVRVGSWRGVDFSLDAQGDYFPGGLIYEPEQRRFAHWRAAEEVAKQQFMAGVRAGRSWGNVALYGRARPGFFRFSDFTRYAPNSACPAVWPIPETCYSMRAKTRPLLDLGVGAIVRTGGRSFLRFDVGDSLVGFDWELRDPQYIGPPDDFDDWAVNRRPYSGAYIEGTTWRHFFQAGVGVGFRF
jgi:hypothetical protein